jgi:hypothetical protein
MKSLTLVAFSVLVSLCANTVAYSADEPPQTVSPKGALLRPADGIQDPAINKAWNDYTAAIQDATAALEAVMDQRIASVRKKGLLAEVEREKAWREMFDQQGILPGHAAMRPDARRAANAFRAANSKLLAAYDAAIVSFTKDNAVEQAKAARDERGGLVVGLGFPPIPNVQEPLFDGQEWTGWGEGWGEPAKYEVINKDECVRLTGYKCFAHEKVLDCPCTFEIEVRNRSWECPKSAVQLGIQDLSGGCLVRIPARDAAGAVVAGKAEMIHYDDQLKQTKSLKSFDCPGQGGWQKCQFSWGGGRYSVVIDGKQVVNNEPLPAKMQNNFRLHIGVGDGCADFRNLYLTENVSIAAPLGGAPNR